MLKVAVERSDLFLLLHGVDYLVRIIPFLPYAPLLSFQDFLGRRVAFVLEPVQDPLVEVIAPMTERVSSLGVGFAKSMWFAMSSCISGSMC